MRRGYVLSVVAFPVMARLLRSLPSQQTAPEDWNIQRARVKASSPTAQGINNALNAIEQGLNALYERILREERYITAEYLKEQFLRKEKPQQSILELYQWSAR